MVLRGERQNRPTYIDLREIAPGSNQLTRCSHVVLGADCVQKTVPIGRAGAAFAEPRLLEALDHPNIPPVREAQFDPTREDCITFVMPWYPGGSAADALVARHRFSVTEAVSVTRGVLDALEYVHTVHGHVHRDIKTSNVLLDEGRSIGHLTDFERAAPYGPDGTAQAVIATVFYMPPEAAQTGRHSIASDIYGVGMVLFELLNGRLPWEDFDPAATERRLQRGLRSFPDYMVATSAFAPQIPSSLVRAVRKATRRDPSERFPSAREFLTTLTNIRAIDWARTAGSGLEGEWIGTWPPRARPSERHRFRVTSRPLEAGRNRGRLRLVAESQRPGSFVWRRFGVEDRTIDPNDQDAARQVFDDVAARAAHLRPTR